MAEYQQHCTVLGVASHTFLSGRRNMAKAQVESRKRPGEPTPNLDLQGMYLSNEQGT